MSNKIPALVVNGGRLHTHLEDATDGYRKDEEFFRFEGEPPRTVSILCDRDETGDPVTVRWTGRALGKEASENLRMLLYGARETGQLSGDPTEVLLPNGETFQID